MDSKDYEKCHYLLHILDLHLDNLIKFLCQYNKMMKANNDSQNRHGARQQDA
jgi:hypothetical protein